MTEVLRLQEVINDRGVTATGSDSGSLWFWDSRSGHNFQQAMTEVLGLQEVINDRGVTATGSDSGSLWFWDSRSGHNFQQAMTEVLRLQEVIVEACGSGIRGAATRSDSGSLWFWDSRSGHNFQQAQTIVQPGSLETEAVIYALTYDVTGTRLITCEADKTIKMWKQCYPTNSPLHFNSQHY
nr:G protein beta subunit-like protein [Ipomoea trifida]